jgi:hypothetical protein
MRSWHVQLLIAMLMMTKGQLTRQENPSPASTYNMLNINVARNLSKFPKDIIEWTSEYQLQLREKEKVPSINY